MKNAVVTVRLPGETRRRIEDLARQEGRSLSAQIGRLLDRAIAAESRGLGSTRLVRGLAGILRGGRTPTLKDFREVRASLSSALGRPTRLDAGPRR